MDTFMVDEKTGSPALPNSCDMNVSENISPIVIGNSPSIAAVKSPAVSTLRSPLQDRTNFIEGGGNKKSESLDATLKNSSVNLNDALVSSQNSTPRKAADCDTESDTTAEYESAGEVSPWEKQSNFSSLAERLARVHLSTPQQGVVVEQTRLDYFPFSPISAEDESDEEITAIISKSKHSPENKSSIITKDTDVVPYNEGRDKFLEVSSPSHSITMDAKSITTPEKTENQNQRNENKVISPLAEFQDAGPACSFHSELMNSIGHFQTSALDNLSMISNRSLIGEACRHTDESFNTSHVKEATESCSAVDFKHGNAAAPPESVLSDSVVNNKEPRLSVSEEDFVLHSVHGGRGAVLSTVEKMSTNLDGTLTTGNTHAVVSVSGSGDLVDPVLVIPAGKSITELTHPTAFISEDAHNTHKDLPERITSTDDSLSDIEKVEASKSEVEKGPLDTSALHANDIMNFNEKELINDSRLEVAEVKTSPESSDNLCKVNTTELVSNIGILQNDIIVAENVESVPLIDKSPAKNCEIAVDSAMSSNDVKSHKLKDLNSISTTESLQFVSDNNLIENKESLETETITKTELATFVADEISGTIKILEVNEELNKSCCANKSISLNDILVDSRQPSSENKMTVADSVSLAMPIVNTVSKTFSDEQSSNAVDMNLTSDHTTIINEDKSSDLSKPQLNNLTTQMNTNMSENVLRLANEKHPACIEECPEAVGMLISPKKLMSSFDTTNINNCILLDEGIVKKDTDGNDSITEICTLIETTFNNVLDIKESPEEDSGPSEKLPFDSQTIHDVVGNIVPTLKTKDVNEATGSINKPSSPSPLECADINTTNFINNSETENVPCMSNADIREEHIILKTNGQQSPEVVSSVDYLHDAKNNNLNENLNISSNLHDNDLKSETEHFIIKPNEFQTVNELMPTNVETCGTLIESNSKLEDLSLNVDNVSVTVADSKSEATDTFEDSAISTDAIKEPPVENNIHGEKCVPENVMIDNPSDTSKCTLNQELNKTNLENYLNNNEDVLKQTGHTNEIHYSENVLINSVTSSDLYEVTKSKIITTELSSTTSSNDLLNFSPASLRSTELLEFPPSVENENSSTKTVKSVNDGDILAETTKEEPFKNDCLLASAECGQGKQILDITLNGFSTSITTEVDSEMPPALLSKSSQGGNVEETKKTTCPATISNLPFDGEKKQCQSEVVQNTPKLEETNKCSAERKSYEDLLDKCLEQERQLIFDTSIKSEADKIADELECAVTTDFALLPQPKTPPLQVMNVNEAKPTVHEENVFEEKEDTFLDAAKFDFDFLSKIRGKPCNNRTQIRESLFLRFDPLANNQSPNSIVQPKEMEQPDSSSDVPATPKKSVLTSVDEKLISLTPCHKNDASISSSTGDTPSRPRHRFSSTSSTPVVRHDFLSREISKLQELMVKQEVTHEEQIASYTEAIGEWQKRVEELEEQLSQAAAENEMLTKSCSALKHDKELLLSASSEYEKLVAKMMAQNKVEKMKHDIKVEELIKEKQTTLLENQDLSKHLINMEIAFNDVHQKYEKCKEVIELFRQNESQYKIALAENEKTISQQTENYRKLKDHASDKLEKANLEISKMTKAHESELAKERACVKKLELRVKSLEEAIEQKQREIMELNKICDELITKMPN